MNNLITFIFGFLAGWLVEWIINWIYWRRKIAGFQSEKDRLNLRNIEQDKVCSEHTQALNNMRSDNSSLQAKIAGLEAENAELKKQKTDSPFEKGIKIQPLDAKAEITEPVLKTFSTQIPIQPDVLIIIKGIGPVINRKLNQAGILTFRQLSEITPARLREIVGDVIQRLANEASIIEQARQLADKKDQGA